MPTSCTSPVIQTEVKEHGWERLSKRQHAVARVYLLSLITAGDVTPEGLLTRTGYKPELNRKMNEGAASTLIQQWSADVAPITFVDDGRTEADQILVLAQHAGFARLSTPALEYLQMWMTCSPMLGV